MSDQGQGQDIPNGYNGGPQGPQYSEDFFIYVATIGSLAAAASTTVNLNIQNDALFEWTMATWNGNLNGATAPFADTVLLPINITLVDSGSSRQLFSAAVPLTAFAGTGKQPFILPVSRFFQANSVLQITATNFGANTYDNLRLNFIGKKLFKL